MKSKKKKEKRACLGTGLYTEMAILARKAKAKSSIREVLQGPALDSIQREGFCRYHCKEQGNFLEKQSLFTWISEPGEIPVWFQFLFNIQTWQEQVFKH